MSLKQLLVIYLIAGLIVAACVGAWWFIFVKFIVFILRSSGVHI